MRSTKNIILLPVFIFSAYFMTGQSPKERTIQQLRSLSGAYMKETIHDTAYLEKTYRILEKALSEGIYFSSKEMIDNLSLFRIIVWESKKPDRYKRIYYDLLCSYAQMSNRSGETLYYAKKIEELEVKNSGRPSLTALTIKSNFYAKHRSDEEVKNLYIQNRSYLTGLASLAKQDILTEEEMMQTYIFLEKVCESLYKLKDTGTITQIYNLGLALEQPFKDRLKATEQAISYIDMYQIKTLYTKSRLEDHTQTKPEVFKKLNELRHSGKTPEFMENYLTKIFYEWNILFFQQIKKTDSTGYYLSQYKQNGIPDEDFESRYFYKYNLAKNLFNSGKYKKSALTFQDAVSIIDESKTTAVKEIDGILYAQAEAEDGKLNLEIANRLIQKRNNIIRYISISFSIISGGVFLYFYLARKDMNRRIMALNNIANLQIALLEETKHTIVKNEQDRLGRDLHDNMCPALAIALHHISFIQKDTIDQNIQPSLMTLKYLVQELYQTMRDKSHELYFSLETMDDINFEERVRTLINIAMPDKHYNKEIHIAEGTIQYINHRMRIEIVRIIQEAIVNIIKHASAKSVSILLYEADKRLILTIADDGKGLGFTRSFHTNKGVGLSSIRQRVNDMNGMMTLNSGTTSTEIDVIIPLQPNA